MSIDDQGEQLFKRTQRMCADPFFRDAVRQHCAFLDPETRIGEFDLTIHPNDQMLRHSINHLQDANASFSQYYNVALQQYNALQQILRALFPENADKLQVLDFACGYGRLLRLLTHSLSVDNITASEIQPEALAFVSDRFGVRVIPSNVDPQAFQPGATFDIIWVASLFSHLPKTLFGQWLERLVQCLKPQGILCFSTHDACLLPAGTPMPESGIHYRPFSENPDLDGSSYGTTFVTDNYVRRSIATACGPDRHVFLIPRGLAHEQDLYVVAGEANTNLNALRGFRYGPWGWVDERVIRPSGELYLRGWAASLDDGALQTVKITVDGQSFDCPTGLPRPDVARVLDDTRLSHCGWEFAVNPAIKTDEPLRVTVTAQTPKGERALLLAGEFKRALSSANLQNKNPWEKKL